MGPKYVSNRQIYHTDNLSLANIKKTFSIRPNKQLLTFCIIQPHSMLSHDRIYHCDWLKQVGGMIMTSIIPVQCL